MTLLHEVRMLFKILILVMFENEHPVFAQQVALENQVDQFVLLLAVVRRIGKDEVVLHGVLFQEPKNIRTHHEQLFHIEFVGSFANESYAAEVHINGYHFWAAARHQFVGNVARSCKQVQGFGFLEIVVVFYDVEQALLGHVGGGAYWQVGGRDDLPPLVSSSDDSHLSA